MCTKKIFYFFERKPKKNTKFEYDYFLNIEYLSFEIRDKYDL